MKKAIILTPIIIVIASTLTLGQSTSVEKKIAERKAGDYVNITNTYDFDGTWIWKEGNSSFKLVLIKKLKQQQPANSKQSYYLDAIYGACVYIQNGKEVLNTLNYIETAPNFVGIVYKDNELKIMLNHVKSYIGGSETTPFGILQLSTDKKAITWKLKVVADDVNDPNHLLPQNMVLTKVN